MAVFSFEELGPDLKLLPLAARRALDAAGIKLSLSAWSAMPLAARRQLTELGSAGDIDCDGVRAAVKDARPQGRPIASADDAALDRIDDRAVALLGATRPLTAAIWIGLTRLERFALRHLGERDDAPRLARAYDEIVLSTIPAGSPRADAPRGDLGGEARSHREIRADAPTGDPGARALTHLSPRGDAHMVDVGEKALTHRRAVARAQVRMESATARMILEESGPKGDVLAVARVAGIMAAKKTAELIPLCHPIALCRVSVELVVDADRGLVSIDASVEAHDRTGVEMEAMVAASVAALTIYDMLKAVQRDIAITSVVLAEKSGGRSGHYRAGRS